MNFWWVSHNGTYKKERGLGYIWCPNTETKGVQRQGYLNLTRVQPGDLIFSYAEQRVSMVGRAIRAYVEEPRPAGKEYGENDGAWGEVGWKVPVQWQDVPSPFVPKDHIEELRPYCIKNGPLNEKGNGKESVYLAEIPFEMGRLVLQLTRSAVQVKLTDAPSSDDEQGEIEASELPPTTKKQLIDARYGHGLFRDRLLKIERKCRVTGVSDPAMLTASHILPWRSGTDAQRLDGENGLMLAPHVDRLFDRGHISFTAEGELLVATPEVASVLKAWHIDAKMRVGSFTAGQATYLAHHHEHVFRSAAAAGLRPGEK